jgi:hypothetical protein
MAEAQTIVRIGKQFGIAYLPLTIMEQKQVLEEHGRRRGLDLKTEDAVRQWRAHERSDPLR